MPSLGEEGRETRPAGGGACKPTKVSFQASEITSGCACNHRTKAQIQVNNFILRPNMNAQDQAT